MKDRYPHLRPITSATKQRCEAAADCLIESRALIVALSAVSVPIDSSEPGRLLSIDAGTHRIGIWNAGYRPFSVTRRCAAR